MKGHKVNCFRAKTVNGNAAQFALLLQIQTRLALFSVITPVPVSGWVRPLQPWTCWTCCGIPSGH